MAIAALSPSLIRELANGAMDQSDLLTFWFGESDRVTPDYIRQAAIDSLQEGETFYQQNLGRPYLRSALSDYLSRLHQRDIGVDRLAVVSAGVSGLMLTAQAILSPGDKVVAVTPIWPNLVEIPRVLGATVTRFPLSIIDGKWQLDVERLLAALTPDTRMLIVNSPGNPTGWTIQEREIDAILAHCRQLGIWVLSDDVYQRLTFDASVKCAPSFLSRYVNGDRIVSVNSFSKAWLMTGFRVGWIVAPPPIVNELNKLIEYNTCCLFEPCQRAAQAALLHGEETIERLRGELRQARQTLVQGLRAIPGIEVPEAGGGMYAFFKIEGYADTTLLAKRLVEQARIGLAPGAAFGPEGQGWLRWCHAVSEEKLLAGVSRLADFIARDR